MMGKKKKKTGTTKRKTTKRKTRKRRAAPEQPGGKRFVDIAIVLMLFLAVYFAVAGGEYSVFEIGKLEALEQERAAELARTRAEIDSLRAVAILLESDPEAIEREARERYGMIREGEILYKLHDEPPADSTKIDEGGEEE